MTRLLELTSKLTAEQLKKVENFAENLVRTNEQLDQNAALNGGQKKIRFGSWVGCMAHVEPEKSDKELLREAWDDLLSKYDK
jgi:hypothetical protein